MDDNSEFTWNGESVWGTDLYWSGAFEGFNYDLTGKLTSAKVLEVSFCPINANGTYTAVGEAWLHTAP